MSLSTGGWRPPVPLERAAGRGGPFVPRLTRTVSSRPAAHEARLGAAPTGDAPRRDERPRPWRRPHPRRPGPTWPRWASRRVVRRRAAASRSSPRGVAPLEERAAPARLARGDARRSPALPPGAQRPRRRSAPPVACTPSPAARACAHVAAPSTARARSRRCGRSSSPREPRPSRPRRARRPASTTTACGPARVATTGPATAWLDRPATSFRRRARASSAIGRVGRVGASRPSRRRRAHVRRRALRRAPTRGPAASASTGGDAARTASSARARPPPSATPPAAARGAPAATRPRAALGPRRRCSSRAAMASRARSRSLLHRRRARAGRRRWPAAPRRSGASSVDAVRSRPARRAPAMRAGVRRLAASSHTSVAGASATVTRASSSSAAMTLSTCPSTFTLRQTARPSVRRDEERRPDDALDLLAVHHLLAPRPVRLVRGELGIAEQPEADPDLVLEARRGSSRSPSTRRRPPRRASSGVAAAFVKSCASRVQPGRVVLRVEVEDEPLAGEVLRASPLLPRRSRARTSARLRLRSWRPRAMRCVVLLRHGDPILDKIGRSRSRADQLRRPRESRSSSSTTGPRSAGRRRTCARSTS